jgi:hypothetical protein
VFRSPLSTSVKASSTNPDVKNKNIVNVFTSNLERKIEWLVNKRLIAVEEDILLHG